MGYGYKWKYFVGGAILAIILGSGCARRNDSTNRLIEPELGVASLNDDNNFYVEDLSNLNPVDSSFWQTNTVYFAFDKYDVSPEFEALIAKHAAKLLASPNLILRVDGHTDDRGSREYNISLGEKRAKAVARVLQAHGVPTDRLVTVSYGKEKPRAFGYDDASWALNRRSELHYEKRS